MVDLHNPDSEPARFDRNNNPSLLGVDETDTEKTTTLMTVTEGGITKLHVKADTELTLNGSVIVNNVDIRDISAGTQTNDVKITLDSEVVSVADDKASSANADTAVTVGNTSTTVLALNANRKIAYIVNDSNETVYLSLSGTATMNSGIRINAEGGVHVESVYTGIITGICSSGSKNVTVTEL